MLLAGARFAFLVLGILAGWSVARPNSPREPPLPSGCFNGPHSRGCWGEYNINTDYSTTWPVTGKTVFYTLEIINTTLTPDGIPKLMLTVNGQYPGTPIIADWGDVLEVTVINKLQNNGTGIHWHGLRQLHTNSMDGVPGVTECPIAPGHSKKYTFLCTQYGTSWYHSHFSGQYSNGVLGTLQINGPATANYDVDLGVMPITDLFYPSFDVAMVAESLTPDNQADNGLINGTMLSPDGKRGRYNVVSLQLGKKYRLRLVNTGTQSQFMVSLDHHDFLVISADFVPIVPYKTRWLFIGTGQRYDVIIEANQKPQAYWFRAEAVLCPVFTYTKNNGNIRSIFTYEIPNVRPQTRISQFPTSTPTNYSSDCTDDISIEPWLAQDVPSEPFETNYEILKLLGIPGPIFVWTINGIDFNIDWAHPTLKYVSNGSDDFPNAAIVIDLPTANEWTYWIIETVEPVNHPIHLHGHDFYVLGTGTGDFPGPSALKWKNPTRRDVTMLPAYGWLAIAFPTDNPGAWLLHCHIAFHVALGFALQFLERRDEISTAELAALEPECSNWATYSADMYYQKGDSGV